MKKFICILLCLSVFLTLFASCKEKEPDETETTVSVEETVKPEEEKEFIPTLGYYSHESFNPFTTESKTNKNILSLVYDSLFKLDENYNAVGEIAESYLYEDGFLTVQLKENLLFSDGSALTASDVAYSFTISQSAPLYSSHLKNFKSCRAEDGSVFFSLYTPDIYAVNCLDFPIVKHSTAGDSKPVGSGRYVLNQKDNSYYLTENSRYSLDEVLEQKRINLYDINNTRNEYYLLQIGELSFVYNDFTSPSPEYKITASTADVSLNNLVFLSFNKKSESLSDKLIKEAVNSAIDKEEICRTIYGSMADTCKTPFNPYWSVTSNFNEDNTEKLPAGELLNKSGYIFEYENNEYRSKDFEYLKLTFIASSEDGKKAELSKLIADKLRKEGIDVNLQIMENDDFLDALRDGDYDMFLGEVKLSADMNLSSFFSTSGKLSYGIDTESTISKAYFDFKAGKIDITTFTKVFEEQLPFIPLCYRKGVAYYSRELQYEGGISENDIFANIYSWSK